MPASFGNIIRPLVWFGSVLATIAGTFAIVVLIATREGDDYPPMTPLAVAVLLLVMDAAQLLFAVFGPSI